MKHYKIIKPFLLYTKMDKKFIMFVDTEIEKKYKFHYYKNPILIDHVDIHKILIFKKISFRKNSFNYFISYRNNKKVKALCIILPKTSAYVKSIFL